MLRSTCVFPKQIACKARSLKFEHNRSWDASVQFKLLVLPPNSVYCSIYSERFPREKNIPCPSMQLHHLLSCDSVSWWLFFQLVSVLRAVCLSPPTCFTPFPCLHCHLLYVVPEFVQQRGELVILLLTQQHASSHLQVFSLFASLPDYQIQ